jgi:5-methylcytosine-specific restriction endonuclease McrA
LRLIRKVAKGVYRFEPELLNPVVLEDFDEATKLAAKERDGWKCIVCFQGEAEGLEIQVDHIIPRAKGGSGEITNAQTLCGRHNYMKTNLDQLAFGRKLFENARKIAATDLATSSDAALVYAFCDAVLRIFDEFKID